MMKLLSRIEELILLSIWRLGDQAYGMAIREEIIRITGMNWLLGAVYGPLGRLLKKNLVVASLGEPKPERGGRAKAYFKLTPKGKKELARIQEVNAILWKNVPKIKTG